MTQPQFDATISTMKAAEAPLTEAAAAIRAFGSAVQSAVQSAAQAAAGASGVGPLAGALGAYGGKVTTKSGTFATAIEDLRTGLSDSAAQYQKDDAGAAAGTNGVDFGVQGP